MILNIIVVVVLVVMVVVVSLDLFQQLTATMTVHGSKLRVVIMQVAIERDSVQFHWNEGGTGWDHT